MMFKRWILSLACCFMVSAHADNRIMQVRQSTNADMARIVFEFAKKPKHNVFYLKKPDRLVLDLFNTATYPLENFDLDKAFISKVRFSKAKRAMDTRYVFELTKQQNYNVMLLDKPHRLVIDLKLSSNQQQTIVPAPSLAAEKSVPTRHSDIIIAIDPGHGGKDPGSIGPSGYYEKHVTLAISKKVAKELSNYKGLKAILTRTKDQYLNLNYRSEVARNGKADLLISIHADAFSNPKPRGASVLVLSEGRAEREVNRFAEDKDKHSELLGGIGNVIESSENQGYLMKSIIDMGMNKARTTGFEIAEKLHEEIEKIAVMHKNKPNEQSLAVLRSPDIPSILIETGFISNRTEEKLLKSASYQNKMAKAIAKAIYNYYQQNPIEGSYLAQNTTIKYTVKRGDSLSKIGYRYGVSVAKLKKVNNLSKDTVYTGQKLSIPRS